MYKSYEIHILLSQFVPSKVVLIASSFGPLQNAHGSHLMKGGGRSNKLGELISDTPNCKAQ